MPPEILERIKTKAFSEWPGDYDMMLHVLRGQVAAGEKILRLTFLSHYSCRLLRSSHTRAVHNGFERAMTVAHEVVECISMCDSFPIIRRVSGQRLRIG